MGGLIAGVGIGVRVGVGAAVGIGVAVGVGVPVGVGVHVGVGVAVGGGGPVAQPISFITPIVTGPVPCLDCPEPIAGTISSVALKV